VRIGENARVPAHTLNEDAVSHGERLIDARQYVLQAGESVNRPMPTTAATSVL
jgi:hypothetical protein